MTGLRAAGFVVARVLAWTWAVVAGLGGLGLLIQQGPFPTTNGWFAMFSGISACPLTAWLLSKYAGTTITMRVQFLIALSIIVAGRIAASSSSIGLSCPVGIVARRS